MRNRTYFGIATAIVAASLLTGCGGGSSSDETASAETTTLTTSEYDVTVERGPVLHAMVMDEKGRRAVEIGNGQYRFAEKPDYPISAFGGFIDVNRDGTVSVGDINNSVVLKAPEGKAATIVSTVAVRNEIRAWLREQFGLTDEMIDDLTPSQDKKIAAISDDLYAYCMENGITDPSTLRLEEIEALRDRILNRIETYLATDEMAADLEEELVEVLDLPQITDAEATTIRTGYTQGHGQSNMNLESLIGRLPTYELSDDQKYALAYMWNEEKLAKDIYLALNDITPHQTLYNIATRSETQHEAAVEALVQKYDINITNLADYTVNYSEKELRALAPGHYAVPEVQELYDALHEKGSASLQAALEVGCMVEVTDVADLDRYIETAGDALDLVVVFKNLRSGSYNHYWAFDGALKAIGVSEGCCSLGEEYCKTAEEFPTEEHGHGHANTGVSVPNHGQGNMQHGDNGQRDPAAITSQTPVSDLSDEQKYALAYMWNEEKLAKDIYLALNALTPHNSLYNIATRSETQHEAAVEALVQKYDINITNLEDYTVNYSEEELRALAPGHYAVPEVQELYDALYEKGSGSLQDALEVGCMVEVTDVADLDKYIEIAGDAPDLVEVFTNLRSGSYNHYWAFDGALKAIGVSDGCCSLGEKYCKTAEEFPSENGGNAGNGGNSGQGKGYRGGRG